MNEGAKCTYVYTENKQTDQGVRVIKTKYTDEDIRNVNKNYVILFNRSCLDRDMFYPKPKIKNQ